MIRTQPTVTVVVVTRDRSEELGRTLRQLEDLPERPDIVVVDNASSDGTAAMVTEHHPDVRLVRAERNLGAAGRNVGVRLARTPVVAFSDDDSWWAPDALAEAASALLAYPSLGLVAARILVGPEERLDPTSAEMAASPLPTSDGLPGTAVVGFLACGAVLRRSAFLDVGGFDPKLGIGAEEHLLALDLRTRGYRMQYLPDIVAHHHPSTRRDADARRRHLARNMLWASWLRRPAYRAVQATARTARQATRDRAVRAGLLEALCGLPWVVRHRDVIPDDVEADLRRLGQ